MSYTANSFNWTDLAVAELKTRWAAGETCSEIARAMRGGLTRNAVIGKVTRLGLQKRRDPHLFMQKPKRKPSIRRNGMGYVKLKSADVPDLVPEKVEPAIDETPPEAFLGIPFLKLDADHCKYPRGGDDGNPITFCGQPRMTDSAYCAACHRRCHSGFHKMELSDAERERRRQQAIKNNLARRAA